MMEDNKKEEKSLLLEFLKRNKQTGEMELDIQEIMECDPDMFREFNKEPSKFIEEQLKRLEPFSIYSFKILNYPVSHKKQISHLRAKELNKFVFISGILKRVSQPTSRKESVTFQCSICGKDITYKQDTHILRKPTVCGCGENNPKFYVVNEKLKDIQELEIEENIDDVGAKQPQRIRLILEGSLTDPNFNKFQAGNKIEVYGILRETPKYILKNDKNVNIIDYSIEVIQINPLESYEDEIGISDEEKTQIREIAANNPLRVLADNISPGLSGLDRIKKAAVLYLAKGVTKEVGVEKRRGESHILVVGEAGLGKSVILQSIRKRAFNCRLADGKDASKAGIVASVVQDKASGKWTLEAGDIVLANKGYLLIDEADKLPFGDMQALHRPMEQGEVAISKANIQANLQSQTSIFAVANPKTGMFDLHQPLIKQLDFSPTLLSRFDLIFVLKDIPDEMEDKRRAHKILGFHGGEDNQVLSPEFIKKYFLYCSKLKPKLEKDAADKLINIFTELRTYSQKESNRTGMPINNRHLEGLIRLSEANAKLRLSDKVEICDVEIAEDLFLSSLSDFGFNKTDKFIDMSGFSTPVKISKKDRYYAGIDIVKKVFETNSEIEKKDLIKVFEERLKLNHTESDELIDLLYESGDIYESKSNTYRKGITD